MLYMVIETFKPGSQAEIYRRLENHGRMLPQGLIYIDSWIDERLTRCFQLMECEDRRLLDEWISHWKDLTDFETVPVIGSDEAKRRALSSGL